MSKKVFCSISIPCSDNQTLKPDEKLDVFAVLGLVGVAADWLSLAVFSLIVAESTVFCRLKFEFVLVWLLFVEVRGTAVGGPEARF